MSVRSHGHSTSGKNGRGSTTYNAWRALKQRCNNPSQKCYKDYGGRGLCVTKRWDTFEQFLADMGERPAGKTLDRIDVNGNYEPSNCRWVTYSVQNRNKRNNLYITYGNERRTITEWSRFFGISRDTIKKRLKNRWTVAEALTTPISARMAKAVATKIRLKAASRAEPIQPSI